MRVAVDIDSVVVRLPELDEAVANQAFRAVFARPRPTLPVIGGLDVIPVRLARSAALVLGRRPTPSELDALARAAEDATALALFSHAVPPCPVFDVIRHGGHEVTLYTHHWWAVARCKLERLDPAGWADWPRASADDGPDPVENLQRLLPDEPGIERVFLTGSPLGVAVGRAAGVPVVAVDDRADPWAEDEVGVEALWDLDDPNLLLRLLTRAASGLAPVGLRLIG